MMTLLIADDHAVVRQGLKQILEEQPDMHVAGEAQNGAEVLDLLGKGPWDAVLMDISMPGRNGLEILKDIRRLQPKLPVLILSVHPESQYAVLALRNGAAGYITKESAPQELVNAVRQAVSGRKYVSASLAEQLASEVERPSAKAPHESLSDRELQNTLPYRLGKDPDGNCRRAVAQRENGKHVPCAPPPEDENEKQRRTDPLRDKQQARLRTPRCRTNADTKPGAGPTPRSAPLLADFPL